MRLRDKVGVGCRLLIVLEVLGEKNAKLSLANHKLKTCTKPEDISGST